MTGFIRFSLRKIAVLASAVLSRLDGVMGVTPVPALIPVRVRVQDRASRRNRR